MSRFIFIIGFLIVILISIFSYFNSYISFPFVSKPDFHPKNQTRYCSNDKIFNDDNGQVKEAIIKGPMVEHHYFKSWHEPYHAMLEPQMLQQIWTEIKSMPSEEDEFSEIRPWSCIGPYGIQRPVYLSHFTGRIKDIEPPTANHSLRLASASGGLWEYFIILPVPLCDKITSLAIGTFATDPTNQNHILVGTGEPVVRNGTGLWTTYDGGNTWSQNSSMSPTPGVFFRIRFTPYNPLRVHAVTNAGYFRSEDGGKTWTRKLQGWTTDIAINTTNTNIMYTAIWGDGIFKTIDGGNNWSKLTTGGIPTSNVGRTSIALCKSYPNYVYVSISTNDNAKTLGVFKSTNDGVTWQDLNITHDPHRGLGGYANTIGVCPTDPSLVFVGGVRLMRTTDGGITWENLLDKVHNDHHAIAFSDDGVRIYDGNDGGIAVSDDKGVTWNTILNILPITQYYDIDVCENDMTKIIGGAQDNGISTTMDGSLWTLQHGWNGGDAWSVSLDPSHWERQWAIEGVTDDPNWRSPRYRTDNYWQNSAIIHNGIDPPGDRGGDRGPYIRNDRVHPVILFTNNGPYIYRSLDYGNTWEKFNTTPFATSWITNFAVTRWNWNVNGGSVIYACLASNNPGQRLMVYDSGVWYERSSSEFPTDVSIKRVATHPYDPNIAYSIMGGLSFTGSNKKIFKTINRGITWTNITGNLPNVPLSDLVAHPTKPNELYLGSEFGCFRTNDGGKNWSRWNYGMPEANIITKMAFVDNIATTGEFYIVAGTYGRGVWVREVNWQDTPVKEEPITQNKIKKFELYQNYPNPFNTSTTIEFALQKSSFVTLKIYNMIGQEVATLVVEQREAGSHKINWDARGLASGVYLYRLEAIDPSEGSRQSFVQVKKLILLR